MHNRLYLTLFALAAVVLGAAGCPKPLPKREKVEIRRFAVPERKHETVARIQSMERSIEAMKEAMVADDERACTEDSECTLTMQHCCTCNMGGQRDAVRLDKNLSLAQRRQGLCKKVICNQMVSTDETCAGEVQAKCVEGRCAAVATAAPEGAEVPTEPIP